MLASVFLLLEENSILHTLDSYTQQFTQPFLIISSRNGIFTSKIEFSTKNQSEMCNQDKESGWSHSFIWLIITSII